MANHRLKLDRASVDSMLPHAVAYNLKKRGINTIEEYLAVHGNDEKGIHVKFVRKIIQNHSEAKELLPKYKKIPNFSCGLIPEKLSESLICVDPGLFLPTKPLPDEFDLCTKFTWKVKDQQTHPICVAEATNGALEFAIKKFLISPVWTYRTGQQATNSDPDKTGLPLDGGLRGLKKYGTAKDQEWRFDPNNPLLPSWPPPDTVVKKALLRILPEWYAIDLASVGDFKRVMVHGGEGHGQPLIIGVPVYSRSWFNAITKKTGKVFYPDPDDVLLGYHAILAVGYNKEMVKFHNSWGTYGDNGYLYLSYKYIEKLALPQAVYPAEPVIKLSVFPLKKKTKVMVAVSVILGFCLGLASSSSNTINLNKINPDAVNNTITQKPFQFGYNTNLSSLKSNKPVSISSKFGWRKNPIKGNSYEFHNGVDIKIPENTVVKSIHGGNVEFAGWGGGRIGICVIVRHNKSTKSIYGHLNKVLVRKGHNISSNDIIGLVGNTGRTTGPHLHFGIKQNGVFTNPLKFNYQQLGLTSMNNKHKDFIAKEEKINNLRRALFKNLNNIIEGGK